MGSRRRLARISLAVLVIFIVPPPSSVKAARPKCFGKIPTITGASRNAEGDIFGTKGPDVIIGTSRFDDIYGRGGNDIICALGNFDFVDGGPGDDRISAGDGDDIVWARDGNDRAFLNSGDDFGNGQGGEDIIHGQGGADELMGGDGDDYLLGEKGDDLLQGDRGWEGGVGDDILDAGPGSDQILEGGAGNDRLIGAGSDSAVYQYAAGPVTVDLTEGRATGEGTDLIEGVDGVTGSQFDDVLTGDARNNFLAGLGGNDTITSGGNPSSFAAQETLLWEDVIDGDILIGDGPVDTPGNDTITGGTGLNIVAYLWARGPVDVDLSRGDASGEGADTLESIQGVLGSDFDDSLTGDEQQNFLDGRAGVNSLDGRGEDDAAAFLGSSGVRADLSSGTAAATYFGELSSDTLTNIEDLWGSSDNDLLQGDRFGNVLLGFPGDDQLEGEEGDDRLFGSEGEDSAVGGAGADTCSAETETECEFEATSPRTQNSRPSLNDWLRRLMGASLPTVEASGRGLEFEPLSP